MNRRVISGLALFVMLPSAAAVARADEIRLKDGTKITGIIVGFENGSFRVETSYGFALIERDKVADINITAAKKESEPKAKSSTPAAPAALASPAVAPAVAKESSSPVGASPGTNAPAPERAAAAKIEIAPLKPKPVAATQVSPPPAPPPVSLPKLKAVAVAPTEPPAPQPLVIRDEIRGNLYVNLTYGFQMYKPPSWDLIPDARTALPDAVAALGTSDETTLLVVGREQTKDSLESHAVATGKALSGVYENYRLISNRHVSVAGVPAIEQRSRGTADGHDWSVTLLTFLRGNDAFTLLGMTWAESDLIQVEENVISKTINSLTFAAH